MTIDYTKNTYGYAAEATSYDIGLRSYMVSVFKNMGISLTITGFVAFLLAVSPQLMSVIFGTPLKYVVMFAPFVMVLTVFPRMMNYTPAKAMGMLFLFSGLMGASISPIFHVYTGESIANVFFITASTFGAMALYGYTTKKNLTSMGSFMIMGLIGVILASVVNIFLASSAMQFVVSVLSVIIFTGLTAWDVQKIKSSYSQVAGTAVESNVAIYGALMLYMDFINLFLSLLQLFGNRRN